ncbi:MAG: hypothetical protein WCI88_02920 [Chloroflexota bacterium]
MKQNISIWASVLILMLVILACNLPFAQKAPPPVPVSGEAVQELKQELATAVQQAVQTGEVNLEITEEQITSTLAQALQKQEQLPISDIQVRLQDGKIQVTGKVSQSGLKLPLDLVVSTGVQNCKPKLKVESAALGPLPLPDDYLNQVMPIAEMALDELMKKTDQPNLCIGSITIGDGKITITGSAPK